MTYKTIGAIESGSGIFFDPTEPLFVRYSSENGYLGRILLTPGIQIHGGNQRLQGTPINLLRPIASGAHISWLSNEIRANTGVRLRAITNKTFQDVSVDDLIALAGSITATRLPAPAGTQEHVFAVKIGEPYLAKVRLYLPAGQNLVHAEWVTYDVQTSKIVGEGFDSPQDLAFGQESTEFGSGEYAYVSDWNAGTNTWQLIKVQGDNGTFDKGFFDVLASGTGQPGQIALTQTDVFVVDGSRVYMAPRNGESSFKVIVDGLSGARGLLVQRDLVNPQDITLYVLANSGGNWTLRSREIDLGGALPVAASSMVTLASGSGTGGFLSFGFEDPAVISFPRVNENKLVRVDLPETLGLGSAIDIPVATTGQTPLGMRSLCAGSASTVFIMSASELGSNDFQLVTADLVMGIGFVPFTSIIESGADIGRADTSDTPGYFFQVKKVPFGGSIHLMLNHRQARLNGAEFYQVTLGGKAMTDNFDDFIWDKTVGKWVIRTTTVEAAGAGGSAYRLRNHDADLWYNPHRGSILNTRKVPDGLHLLTVTFLNASGNPVAGAGAGGSRTLLIDNTNSIAKLDLPILNAQAQALTCGCLKYGGPAESFEIGFVAAHPRNEARYNLQVYRGSQLLPAPISDSNVPVPNAGSKMLTVGEVLGDCNVVNIRVSLYVPLRITNGHGWAYTGAEAHRHFTLVPRELELDRK